MVEKRTLLKKINELRTVIANADIKKSGKNRFQNFEYYELADFLPAVIRHEVKLGLISMFNLGEKATLTVYDVESGEFVEFVSNVRDANVEKMIDIQRLGSQHTYLKRYLYLNYLNLTEPDTVDNQDQNKTGGGTNTQGFGAKKRIDLLRTLISKITPEEETKIYDKYHSLTDVPDDQLQRMVDKVKDRE